MKRIIVANSALAYPPPPESVLQPGDAVLPLVERFEDALFMSLPGYELQERFPEWNLEVRALARSLGDLLPEWVTRPVPAWGHSAWDTAVDHFVKYSLGPILCNAELARQAARNEPDEVVAWELPHRAGWWSGRELVADVAHAIAAESGAHLELRTASWRRAVRDLVQPGLSLAHGIGYFRRARSAPGPEPTECDVLIAITGPTVVPLFDRVARRLQDEHDLRVQGIDVPIEGPGAMIREGELPRASLHALLDGGLLRRGAMDAVAGARTTGGLSRALAGFEPLRDLPAPLRSALVRRLRATLARTVPECLLHARLWERALDAARPSVFAGYNAYGVPLAPGVLQARHRGIPAVMLQHGMFGTYFKAGALLPYDELMVLGPYAREVLAPLASRHTSFFETGHSQFDDLCQEPELGREAAALRKELLKEHKHLVLATTQPIEVRLRENESRWWLELLGEACRGEQALLAIKPHPDENAMLVHYREIAERMPDTVRVIRHGEVPLRLLIAACDLLATRFSTTAVEAALLSTPVMTVNLGGGADRYPYVDEGAAEGVYSPQEMYPTLHRLLSEPQARRGLIAGQRRFLDRHLGFRDGRATERIASRIALWAGGKGSTRQG